MSDRENLFFRSQAFNSTVVQERPVEFQTIKMVTSIQNQKDKKLVDSFGDRKIPFDVKVDLARQIETAELITRNQQEFKNPSGPIMTTDKRMQDLMQDNRRMREVIEGLQQEIQLLSRQNQASTSIISMEAALRAELQAKEMELARLRQYLADIENQRDQQSSIQLQGARKEADEWKQKFNQLQADYNALLNRLNQYSMLEKQLQSLRQELEDAHADADNWKYMLDQQQQEQENQRDQHNTTLNHQIDGLNNEIEGYQNQINQWRIKYDNLLGEMERLKDQMQRMQTRKEIDRLSQLIDGYRHEIESWKQRYITLEMRLNEIQSQNNSNLLLEYQKMLQQMEKAQRELRSQFDQKDNTAKKQQAAELEQKTREYTNRINSLEDENNQLRMENEQLKKLLDQLKEDNNRLSGYVSQEDYRAIQLELDYFKNKAIEMEADIEILIQDINSRPKLEDVDALKREYEARLSIAGGDQLSSTDKQQVDVWKKRYMECEVQLKEFDNLKQHYAELQNLYEQLQQKKFGSISVNDVETTQLKQQFEQEINNYILRIKELEQKITILTSEKDRAIKSYEQNITILTNEKERALKQVQSYEQNTTNENMKLIQSQSQDQSANLRLELEKCNKIRSEQESKIQMLIQKVTEYESMINILREENKRLDQRLKERIKSGSGGLGEFTQEKNQVLIESEQRQKNSMENPRDVPLSIPLMRYQFGTQLSNLGLDIKPTPPPFSTPQFQQSAKLPQATQNSSGFFEEHKYKSVTNQNSKALKNQIITSGTKTETFQLTPSN